MNLPASSHVIRRSALRLGLFGLVCLLGVSLMYALLRERIVENEHRALLSSFDAIYSETLYDKHLFDLAFPMLWHDRELVVYPVFHEHELQAYFVRSTTPHGYSGDIELLMAFQTDGRIIGVRVLRHHETPGLGDKIDAKISPWIFSFNGRSLADTHFDVKKNGGDFDAFSGASITPRAVARQVGAVLQHYSDHQEDYRREAQDSARAYLQMRRDMREKHETRHEKRDERGHERKARERHD